MTAEAAHLRYQRQVALPGVGADGQSRLARAHAAVIGCGALGCTAADLLARAGVGTITIIDRDLVELSNLQRQPLFDERDAAEALPKAEAARRRLAAVNSSICVVPIVADLHARNAERLLGLNTPSQREGAGGRVPPSSSASSSSPVSVLLDGTDNFETRYLLNDLAVKHQIPYIYGGVVGTRGMQAAILPGDGPCLRCYFEDAPAPGSTPTCETAGVLGPAAAIIAACQAADALKVLLGRRGALARSLLEFDLWTNHRRRIAWGPGQRRADCLCCGEHHFEFLSGERGSRAVTLCGQRAVQVRPVDDREIDLAALAARLAEHGTFARSPFVIRGTLREPVQGQNGLGLTVFADGRAIIHGTDQTDTARAVYSRYVGM